MHKNISKNQERSELPWVERNLSTYIYNNPMRWHVSMYVKNYELSPLVFESI